jgi:hypothetical protein
MSSPIGAPLRQDRRGADPDDSVSIHRVHPLALALVALALAFAGTSTAGAGLRNCGGGVRAAVVSCSKAKRIAKEYAKNPAKSLQGYTCSDGGSQGRCVLDRKVVTFPL